MNSKLEEFKQNNSKYEIHNGKDHISLYLLVREEELEQFLVEELGFTITEDSYFLKTFPPFVSKEMKDTFERNLTALMESL